MGHTIERRAFLKAAAIVVAGPIFAYGSKAVEPQIDADVNRRTDFTSGDLRGEAQAAHPSTLENPAIQAVTEEVIFRAVPSIYASWRGKLHINEPIRDVAIGVKEDHDLTTRREFLAGGLSTLAYSGYSNLTDRRIDINTVPVSPAFRGLGLWVLQRKLGIVANTAANFLRRV
ncbi:MAG: hypothetical protein HY426_02580 [Candidatus Levybacteria bacterium]|nr:hypothetical protein [Candidatus Levybacteria bacterium]